MRSLFRDYKPWSITRWLSEEARHAWKWLGVQLPVVTGSLGMLYGQVDFLQEVIGPKWYGVLNGVLCIAMVWNSVRRKA